jgi:hypothetical protein
MFEFRWKIPGEPAEDAVLRIHSRSGWFGRKVLTLGDRRIFRRGWFEGIDARFFDPRTGCALHLRAAQIPNSALWRPALFCENDQLPELTGTHPPRVVQPPKLLAVVFGLTYLLMLLAVVMFPSTVEILDAVHAGEPGYTAARDIVPWIIPFLVTAGALLAVLNLRRWAVLLFAGLILAQIVLSVATSVPISLVGVAIQGALWLVGAACWGKMC